MKLASWRTVMYLASAECETCRWAYRQDGDTERGRAAARRHAEQNPTHRVRVEVGRTTIYNESAPGVPARASDEERKP